MVDKFSQGVCSRGTGVIGIQPFSVHTIRAQSNSNDIGRFFELFSRFEFEFCRRGNCFKKKINSNFFCVQGPITYTVIVHVHVSWPVCTYRISIPNVVVSLMIYDNVHLDICTCICVSMCVSFCVSMCVECVCV